MTTKTTPAAPAKPERQKTKVRKTAECWLLAAAVIEAPALLFRSPALAALGIVILIAVAGFRVRKAHHRWRSGGKAAMRHRAKFQGHATLAEIRRNLSHDQGVPIGTVRSTR